jgi:hypothetical protein
MFHAFALSICGAPIALVVVCAFEWRHRRTAHGTTQPHAPRCPFSIRAPLLGRCAGVDGAG